MWVDRSPVLAKTRKRQDGDSSTTPTATLGRDQYASNERPDSERISARAYELYLARGGTDGQDWDDWLAAERELSEAAAPPRDRDE